MKFKFLKFLLTDKLTDAFSKVLFNKGKKQPRATFLRCSTFNYWMLLFASFSISKIYIMDLLLSFFVFQFFLLTMQIVICDIMKWLSAGFVKFFSRIFWCIRNLLRRSLVNDVMASKYAAQGRCWYEWLTPWYGFAAWKKRKT